MHLFKHHHADDIPKVSLTPPPEPEPFSRRTRSMASSNAVAIDTTLSAPVRTAVALRVSSPTPSATGTAVAGINPSTTAGAATTTETRATPPPDLLPADAQPADISGLMTTLLAPFVALTPLIMFVAAPPIAIVMAFTRLGRRAWIYMGTPANRST